MNVIGIESSCDETSIGLVRDGQHVLASLIYSQVDEHKQFSGVVPEIASRAHVEKINFIFHSALKQANMTAGDIDLIGIVNQPGLVGSLMVGVAFAKTLSLYINKPIITVNHLIAHLYANFLLKAIPEFPYIGLVVSGGHTLLLIAKSHFEYEIAGSTLDDAVGEAYDKVAKLLGLGYPGGPVMDRIAREHTGEYVKFNPGLKSSKKNKYNFSYSGIKTAVLYHIRDNPCYDRNKVVKGFQIAAIDILLEKTKALSADTGIERIVVAGGVAANSYLREIFGNEKGMKVFLPELRYCTDNGAMVASCAYYKSQLNQSENMDFDVYSKPSGGGRSYLKSILKI
ncbi:MAG: tRNA (adenosine(37)-N6)-threonylcarbamoyltransferase complex transferase subunit TsaD [bacterium]|nr:tRNA (adenosine(37)-N6)-threonylcarbamoyltransferase complex transferase subunit TsaD [bacterium]